MTPSGISIVCVYNDLAVREQCLDASIEAYAGDLDVDYVPVDNREHAFTSAGAALNHGAALARHDVVVFVHQDVHLHSLDRIAQAGEHLAGDQWGILGANGFSGDGESVGRIRDRVTLIGSSQDTPAQVDSLDEVLFMVRRDRILEHPLTLDPDLAWHAYAVEYGLRMRGLGLGVGAINLSVTHNSLTINLARLDVAHRRVAALYPLLVPVQTTCGVVGGPPQRVREIPLLQGQRWRLRWLRSSRRAVAARKHVDLPVVLADIRHDVDLLDVAPSGRLNVINLDHVGGFDRGTDVPVTLNRREIEVTFWAAPSLAAAATVLAELPPSESALITDLADTDLALLSQRLPAGFDWLLGFHDSSTWVLGGPAARKVPQEWRAPKAVPLGAPSPARR